MNTTIATEYRGPVDEKLSGGRLLAFGVQHLLTFYATIVVLPVIIAAGIGLSPSDTAFLLGAVVLAGGIGSLIQAVGFWKIGIRYPLILGGSAVAIGPTIAIAVGHGGPAGMSTVFTSTIIAGVVLFLVAPLYGRVSRFFPPVVMGSVILLVGLSVLPISAQLAGGGDLDAPSFGGAHAIAVSVTTIVAIVLVHSLARGVVKSLAILVGLVVGTLLGAALGDVDASAIGAAGWFAVVPPFHFGGPVFDLSSTITMTITIVIVAVESTASFFAVGEIVEHRPTHTDVARGIRGEGLATVLGGVFNAIPPTTFNGNVGLLRTSGVRSRWVCALVGVLMIVLSCCPKISALATLIPTPAVGGALLVLFGIIATIGIKTLSQTDLSRDGNLLIVALSLGIGTIAIAAPAYFQHLPGQLQTVLHSGIVCGALVAILLNIAFNHRRAVDGSRSPGVVHVPPSALGEFYTHERVFITELHNSDESPASSLALARVEVGVTTQLHSVTATVERYIVRRGEGLVEIDGEQRSVGVGDQVVIPEGAPQRITNTGTGDLEFYCLCTPRFLKSAYVNLEP
ncbi:solute carrier family 23 protein [Pseudonocardia spinosispora]|uniref:solute carrier family 23 protein n=1 Tax=Pseudonocardia spinosispora TaxID=103441 RepID=UPI0003FD17A0|nr:solute carrier family 23 protein [Pseudonocardia spinosispora]